MDNQHFFYLILQIIPILSMISTIVLIVLNIIAFKIGYKTGNSSKKLSTIKYAL